MTQLTDFLLADGPMANGQTFGQVMNQSPSTFELHHDQIQWMFPLPKPSNCQPGAPILTRAEYDTLKAGYFHLDRLVSAKRFMLEFLNEYKLWMVPQDHNHLRITRVIECASLFRGHVYADDFRIMVWNRLRVMNRHMVINDRTLVYWLNATRYGESEEVKQWKS